MTKEEATVCQRAQGYLELGLADLALEELDVLPLASLDDEMVVKLRAEVLSELKRWLDVVELCRPWLERAPREVAWWFHSSYAARRCQGLEAAELLLMRALVFHENEAILHYNLACYQAMQGRAEDALESLGRAMELDRGSFYPMALKDADLQAVWGVIRERWG